MPRLHNYVGFHNHGSIKDSVAQWIRRWSTEPEILGSIPSGVGFFFFFPLLIISGVIHCMPTLEASKSFIKKKFCRVHALVLEF